MISKEPARNLKTIAFPDCARQCAFVKLMGAGECESACPWKFDHTGNPVDSDKLKPTAAPTGGMVRCPVCGSATFIDSHTPASDHPELSTDRHQCEKCDWHSDDEWPTPNSVLTNTAAPTEGVL